MNWDTIQQIVRIILQIVAGSLIASGVIRAEDAPMFIGGLTSIAAFAWWWFWDRKRPDVTTSSGG